MANTSLLIRRVRLDPAQVSAGPRSRRRRTLHPDQRALAFPELARADAIYAYSFILTNLDVSTPGQAVAAEHWYRHRTTVENIFRDSKHGAALRHLPSGYPRVNMAWMWGALLAATMAAWLHQLTAVAAGEDILAGHGVRGGKAMIATLRRRLIAVPARLTSPDPQKRTHPANPALTPGSQHAQHPESPDHQDHSQGRGRLTALRAESGQMQANSGAVDGCGNWPGGGDRRVMKLLSPQRAASLADEDFHPRAGLGVLAHLPVQPVDEDLPGVDESQAAVDHLAGDRRRPGRAA